MATRAQIQARLDAAAAQSQALADYIESRLVDLQARGQAVEARLLEDLVARYLPILQLVDGTVAASAQNYASVAAMDAALVSYQRAMGALVDDLAQWSLEVATRVQDYFNAGGFNTQRLATVAKDFTKIQGILGIQPNGALLPGGYLDRLAQSVQVKQLLQQYMLQQVTTQASLASTTQGLRTLVMGAPGGTVNGALVRYLEQYAYDTFNQIREVRALEFAQELGLVWFIYQGSIIKTTRQFCRKRAGKVFNVEQTKTWKNDPDLIEKKTKDSYKPLLERGRYNCRHWLDYISAETAAYLKQQNP